MKHTLSYWVLDVDITLIRGHLRQLDTFPQAASVKLDTLLHVKGSHLLFLRTEWYSKTDHLGVSTAHNNGHKTLTRRGTKPQCLKIPKLFKSMLGLPNIWAFKWEICFMQMSTVKKTNECNHQCIAMFVMGSPCLLTVQQRVSETILLKICQCFECLALRCSPISESRLDAFSQRSGSKVQWWQLWMRNGSQVILPPLCCQILADCPRATSAKLRNWCLVQPCRGFIWFSQQRGNNVFFKRSKCLILVFS